MEKFVAGHQLRSKFELIMNIYVFVAGELLVLILLAYLNHLTALLCYSCQDVNKNEDCMNVTVCKNNDVCFARSDGFDTGFVKHTLGCRSIQAMSATKALGRFTFCDHICQEDLCNLKMCALQGNSSRPPRCLSCASVKRPGECNTVKLCNNDEICYTAEFMSFGEVRYRLGCVSKQHCEKMNSLTPQPVAVGRRSSNSSSLCSKCCTADHCNDFICANSTRDNGHVGSFQKIYIDVCEDSNQAICKGYGILSKDSCKLDIVQNTCKRSCGTCGLSRWSNWQSWSSCTRSCGSTGKHTRIRSCNYILSHLKNVSCTTSSSETKECNRKHCPVNGGWCFGTEKTGCHWSASYYTCDGSSTVQTTCDCPTPAYGGKKCT